METVAVCFDGKDRQAVLAVFTGRASVTLRATLRKHAAFAVPIDEAGPAIDVKVTILISGICPLQTLPGKARRANAAPVVALTRLIIRIPQRLIDAANLRRDISAFAVDPRLPGLRLNAETVATIKTTFAGVTLFTTRQLNLDRLAIGQLDECATLAFKLLDRCNADAV